MRVCNPEGFEVAYAYPDASYDLARTACPTR